MSPLVDKVRYWKIRFMLLCRWAGASCLFDRKVGVWSGPQEKGNQPPKSKSPCWLPKHDFHINLRRQEENGKINK